MGIILIPSEAIPWWQVGHRSDQIRIFWISEVYGPRTHASLRSSLVVVMGSETDSATGKAWGKTTLNYSSTVAGPSGIAADRLVDLAEKLRNIDEESYVLDLGTGTGAVALDVARRHSSTKVLATDISTGMVESVAELRVPNISTRVLDALEIDLLGHETFSHVFSTFVLQFIHEPDLVLSQTYAALKPGGVFGLGLWYENIHPFEIWQKACSTIEPTYRIETEFPDPNAWLKPEQVKQHLEMAKFVDVRVIDIWMPYPFAGCEAYMDFWDRGKNPSAWHVIEQWKGDRQQAMDAVRKVVREQYGDGQDIKLHAILAVGRKS